MNQKLIIFLSVVIILLSVIGLSSNVSKKPSQEVQARDLKQNYAFLTATRDLSPQESLSATDLSVETVEDVKDKDFGDVIMNANKDFLIDSIVLKNVPKGARLTRSDVALLGSVQYEALKARPKEGLFSFSFELQDREAEILKNLKPGDFADIWFLYETKNKKNVSILPKKDEKNPYSNDENANSANLRLLFPQKRVLFLEKIVQSPSQDLQNPMPSRTLTRLHVEMSSEEIRRIYVMEGIGNFFPFPSVRQPQTALGTENILPKEFIREYRGGLNAKENSF